MTQQKDIEQNLKSKVNTNALPKHVAIIMDGNGRWAKRHGKPRVFGHRNGVQSVRNVTEAAAELGISHITLYAFSKENWSRPANEVGALMELLVLTIGKEVKTLMKNDIRLRTIGEIINLPERCNAALKSAIEKTAENKRMDLHLALSYSGRDELVRGFKMIHNDVLSGTINIEDVNEKLIANYLYAADTPNPELLIRTSGERRISNFLLWQTAYTELYFTEELWPDFSKSSFYQALIDYQKRERRFGLTGDQLPTKEK